MSRTIGKGGGFLHSIRSKGKLPRHVSCRYGSPKLARVYVKKAYHRILSRWLWREIRDFARMTPLMLALVFVAVVLLKGLQYWRPGTAGGTECADTGSEKTILQVVSEGDS